MTGTHQNAHDKLTSWAILLGAVGLAGCVVAIVMAVSTQDGKALFVALTIAVVGTGMLISAFVCGAISLVLVPGPALAPVPTGPAADQPTR